MLDSKRFDLWADGYDKCREENGGKWDNSEIYCVAEELRSEFPNLRFEKITFCSGILILSK